MYAIIGARIVLRRPVAGTRIGRGPQLHAGASKEEGDAPRVLVDDSEFRTASGVNHRSRIATRLGASAQRQAAVLESVASLSTLHKRSTWDSLRLRPTTSTGKTRYALPSKSARHYRLRVNRPGSEFALPWRGDDGDEDFWSPLAWQNWVFHPAKFHREQGALKLFGTARKRASMGEGGSQ